MLRSYNPVARKQFQFSYVDNKSTKSSKITNQDVRILNQIEKEINNLVSRVYSLGHGYIDTTDFTLVINQKLSLLVKNILNQYDISHFERNKWCGIRKYTMIIFDKIIPRIIYEPLGDVSIPPEHIVSNVKLEQSFDVRGLDANASLVINIKIPNINKTHMDPNDTYRHDYLNPANKAQARKLRGIYNA